MTTPTSQGWFTYNLYEDGTYDLHLVFSTKQQKFSFEKALRALHKKTKHTLSVPDTVNVPDKFNWYVLRQTKKHVLIPHVHMQKDGAKVKTMTFKSAHYDTSDADDWKLNVCIQGRYEKVI